jgi:pimeloyl-ACP methyl ester carboxylesterase
VTAENTPAPSAPDMIVLVHGFWVTPLSWEKWVERYEGRGYRVLTPTYPGFEGGLEALRKDPSPIEALTIPSIIEHIGGIIDELERPPIIMGHSAGGVLTQTLLDHGYGAAGVAIDSVPAEGAASLITSLPSTSSWSAPGSSRGRTVSPTCTTGSSAERSVPPPSPSRRMEMLGSQQESVSDELE